MTKAGICSSLQLFLLSTTIDTVIKKKSRELILLGMKNFVFIREILLEAWLHLAADISILINTDNTAITTTTTTTTTTNTTTSNNNSTANIKDYDSNNNSNNSSNLASSTTISLYDSNLDINNSIENNNIHSINDIEFTCIATSTTDDLSPE